MRISNVLSILVSMLLLTITTNSIVYAVNSDKEKNNLNPDFTQYSNAPWQAYVGPDDTLVTMNPVNPETGTRILWNGKDITDETALKGERLEPRGAYFSFYGWPYIFNGKEKFPNDGFALSVLNPETTAEDDAYTTETEIAFLWTAVNSVIYPTFALDGESVASVAFTGLPDDALVSVAPDGICLRFKKPGEYAVTYTVTDSAGLAKKFPAKCTFEILLAK